MKIAADPFLPGSCSKGVAAKGAGNVDASSMRLRGSSPACTLAHVSTRHNTAMATTAHTGLAPARSRATWVLALGYLAAYLVLDWASYIRPLQGLNITPWNPQPALAIALLILSRRWIWLVWAGLVAAEFVVRGVPVELAGGTDGDRRLEFDLRRHCAGARAAHGPVAPVCHARGSGLVCGDRHRRVADQRSLVRPGVLGRWIRARWVHGRNRQVLGRRWGGADRDTSYPADFNGTRESLRPCFHAQERRVVDDRGTDRCLSVDRLRQGRAGLFQVLLPALAAGGVGVGPVWRRGCCAVFPVHAARSDRGRSAGLAS